MAKRLPHIVVCVLILGMIFWAVMSSRTGNTLGEGGITEDSEEYTFYWIIGQLPNQTHVYLYAREGANVTFNGTISAPVLISVPPDQFVWYNIGDLGYSQTGTEWYFLEMCSDKPLMVNFDRAVYIKTGSNTYEWRHGDSLHNMPMTELNTTYYIPSGRSGSEDDRLVMHAHEPTQVTVRALANTGSVWVKDITIDGLYVSGHLRQWLFSGSNVVGYGLNVTSDKPIAASSFDELPEWPSPWLGSGYYFSGPTYTKLFNEYMHIHSSTTEGHAIYTPSANTLQYHDISGNLVGTKVYSAEASASTSYSDVGYSGSPDPFLVHVNSSDPYADSTKSPTARYINNIAAYMGWNSSMGVLEVYTDHEAHIQVYNGRNYTIIKDFNMSANTIFQDSLANIGFEPNQPFLAVVVSEDPVYQTVKIPYYLRPYPAELGPPVVPPPPPPTLYIKVSEDGRDVIPYWDPPPVPGIEYYLLYRSTSQIGFDFTTVWKNTSVDKEPGELSPIPLRTMWNDTNASFIGNDTNYEEQYYYTIRAVNVFGEVSSTSRTVGKWTKAFPKGVSTFSLPLEPLQALWTNEIAKEMNADYIKFINVTPHAWAKHNFEDGDTNNTQMILGEGFEVKFSNQTNYTFTGMPGAMISYDDDNGFLGFDHATEAKNLTVIVEPSGDVNLSWQEPTGMRVGDWYEVYYSNKRDGFFGAIDSDYFFVCPPVNFGNNTATHISAKASDPGARLYYMVVPFNSSGVRGSSTYSIGIWTEEYLSEYDTFGIPLKLSSYHTADWYCDNIPGTVGINYFNISAQRWSWHSTRMFEGAYDPILIMTEGYQISTSSATKYTFIGV